MERNGRYSAHSNSSFPELNFAFDANTAGAMAPPGPPPPPGALGFGFDFTAGSNLFPGDAPTPPPLLGSQPDLLSSTDQTHVLGFLDTFEWPFDPKLPHGMPIYSPSGHPGPSHTLAGSNNHFGMDVEMSSAHNEQQSYDSLHIASKKSANTESHSSSPNSSTSTSTPMISLQSTTTTSNSISKDDPSSRPNKRRKSSPDDMAAAIANSSSLNVSSRPARPLLTQPQKRLNHIMSEQRRRNAIKDGYATIEQLIAPDPRYIGPPPSINNTQDGKGRGRAAKGKGRGKGKMGTLFRAVEYVNFLDAGIAGLRFEVERLEAAMRDHRGQFSSHGGGIHGGNNDVNHLLKFAFPLE